MSRVRTPSPAPNTSRVPVATYAGRAPPAPAQVDPASAVMSHARCRPVRRWPLLTGCARASSAAVPFGSPTSGPLASAPGVTVAVRLRAADAPGSTPRSPSGRRLAPAVRRTPLWLARSARHLSLLVPRPQLAGIGSSGCMDLAHGTRIGARTTRNPKWSNAKCGASG